MPETSAAAPLVSEERGCLWFGWRSAEHHLAAIDNECAVLRMLHTTAGEVVDALRGWRGMQRCQTCAGGDVEAALHGGAPLAPRLGDGAQRDPSLIPDERVHQIFAGIGLCRCGLGTAGGDEPRNGVGAVGGVEDECGTGEREVVFPRKCVAPGFRAIHHEGGGVKRGIPALFLEALYERVGACGEKGGEHAGTLGGILDIHLIQLSLAGIGVYVAPIVAPSCGFVVQGQGDYIVQAVPQCLGRLWCQQAAGRQVLVGAVDVVAQELAVLHQIVEDVGGAVAIVH